MPIKTTVRFTKLLIFEVNNFKALARTKITSNIADKIKWYGHFGKQLGFYKVTMASFLTTKNSELKCLQKQTGIYIPYNETLLSNKQKQHTDKQCG